MKFLGKPQRVIYVSISGVNGSKYTVPVRDFTGKK